jgi:hypothetical protein
LELFPRSRHAKRLTPCVHSYSAGFLSNLHQPKPVNIEIDKALRIIQFQINNFRYKHVVASGAFGATKQSPVFEQA